MRWKGSATTRGRCEGRRSRDYGLRSSSVELTVSHCTHSNDLSAIYFNIILLVMFISHTRSRSTKCSNRFFFLNCFFHFRTSFTGWKVMSGKSCKLYRGERSEFNGAQYTLGRDYGSITSQYTLGPDYGLSQVRDKEK